MEVPNQEKLAREQFIRTAAIAALQGLLANGRNNKVVDDAIDIAFQLDDKMAARIKKLNG